MRPRSSSRVPFATSILVLAAIAACNSGPKSSQTAAPAPSPSAAPVAPAATPAAPEGALRLGAAIEASAPKVALSDIAKKPDDFVGKTFATTGTVTAVCQHMGCWMEIKDDASAAHIKMAGHAFFVPKTASGRKAKVLAKLEKAENEGSCEGEGHDGKMAAAGGGGADHDHAKGKGCRAEAEQQLGRPLAKLELVAEGVELM
jgi:hypothetical protein